MNVNKQAMQQTVVSLCMSSGLMAESEAEAQVNWVFNGMGLDEHYFSRTPAEQIALHVQCISTWSGFQKAKAKLTREEGSKAPLDFRLEGNGEAIYACESAPTQWSPQSPATDLEDLLESKYLLEGYRGTSFADKQDRPWDMNMSRSSGTVSADSDAHLQFYFLERPEFPEGDVDELETDFKKIASKSFQRFKSARSKATYQALLERAVQHLGPVFQVDTTPNVEKRLLICYRQGTTHSFFSSLSCLIDSQLLYSHKKEVRQFKNGWVIMSIYLRAMPGNWFSSKPSSSLAASTLDDRIAKVLARATFSFAIPRSSLSVLMHTHHLDAEEVAYAYALWKFAYTFMNRQDAHYQELLASVADSPAIANHVKAMKGQLHQHAYSEEKLRDVFLDPRHNNLIKALYANFKSRNDPKGSKGAATLKELEALATKSARSQLEIDVFEAALRFNRHVLKTNFYKKEKTALAFRFDPSFLLAEQYPDRPFAIFMFVGAEFRGFHIRFVDIARGGIRIVRSRNQAQLLENAQGLFDENYGLAHTQQRKNKDIPEGGSKGTILLSLAHQDKAESAFKKYIDAMLDLLLVNASDVKDHYQQEEIVFCGPDEGTADVMDWAANHARKRGASFWRAFTTGKSTSMGGIPHDMFGMTTRSVHQYVLGVLRKLGKKESEVTKFQTGGPDGDLGSNEILLSDDKTTSIVDGSGVLHDPNGLNRTELVRLAKGRKMIEHFDVSFLSPLGFRVLCSDRDKTLPDGTVVQSGLVFRNNFHLLDYSSADMFVPCGGRPNSVTSHNYKKLLRGDGSPRFPIIVEGANLFLTQDARLALEQAGCVLYKDASANKGGVTSSSCEVLSCLALSDSEHAENMQVVNGKVPSMYAAYVENVQSVIEHNARMEFERIWEDAKVLKLSRAVLSDRLSNKINELTEGLLTSSLYDNMALRRKTILKAAPSVLVDFLGVDTIMKRVPDAYVRAMFGSYLASRYVYKYGLASGEFDFFDFINSVMASDDNSPRARM